MLDKSRLPLLSEKGGTVEGFGEWISSVGCISIAETGTYRLVDKQKIVIVGPSIVV